MDKKEIKIETGNGSELEFSPVYEHLNALKPKSKSDNKKKSIIIPEAKKQEKK